jgi:repressor LexA
MAYKEERPQLDIFSSNLKRIMANKDIGQNELSRKLGCSAPTVNSWCQGYTMPRRELFEKLCQVLNVTRNDLMQDKTAAPNLSVPAAHPVMILGAICAGKGITAEENFRGMFFVDHSIRADYCLEVEGDSMRDANIYHGDIAFLRKNYEFINGGIYAVVFGSEQNAVLKRVYKQGDALLLMPCNQLYDPISVSADEPFTICGGLVGVYSPRNNKYVR